MFHQTLHRPSPLASWLAVVVIIALATAASADPSAAPAKPIDPWLVKDTAGREVRVPHPDRTTILAFLMTDQSRSDKAMEHLCRLIGDGLDKQVQVVAVVSGQGAEVNARKIDKNRWPWTIVADPQYDLSGSLHVRAWPTTVVVGRGGEPLGQISGLPSSYAKNVGAYLEFAVGKIDRQALDKRLVSHAIVTSTAGQVAARHLEVGLRLLERGQINEARQSLQRGLKAVPDDTGLRLAMARVHLLSGQADHASAILDTVASTAAPPWQIATLRGRALIALGQWDGASTVLADALKLNPDPTEAHYLMARVYEHDGDWRRAAEHYRAAFEHTGAARHLGFKPAPPVKPAPKQNP